MQSDHQPIAVPCWRCGYDLRATAVHSTCPECGEPVRESTQYLAVEGDVLVVTQRMLIPRLCIKTGQPVHGNGRTDHSWWKTLLLFAVQFGVPYWMFVLWLYAAGAWSGEVALFLCALAFLSVPGVVAVRVNLLPYALSRVHVSSTGWISELKATASRHWLRLLASGIAASILVYLTIPLSNQPLGIMRILAATTVPLLAVVAVYVLHLRPFHFETRPSGAIELHGCCAAYLQCCAAHDCGHRSSSHP